MVAGRIKIAFTNCVGVGTDGQRTAAVAIFTARLGGLMARVREGGSVNLQHGATLDR
jgi:hypothetical protein